MTVTAPRTALVTGGSKGIGRAVAERLGRAGIVVAIHYGHDDAAAKDAVARVRDAGGRAFAVQAALGAADAVEVLGAGLETGLRELTGRTALDIIVNSAGVGCRSDITTITPADLDRALEINLKSPVFIVQRLLPLMRDGGRIVNISSVAHRVAHPQVIGYAMSKGALEAFTRSLAAQVGARGITVNSVTPGLIETEFHGDRLIRHPEVAAEAAALTVYGRLGRPADVADVVVFLTSEEARWITGQSIETTGGAYL